jgi:hypothetical protein
VTIGTGEAQCHEQAAQRSSSNLLSRMSIPSVAVPLLVAMLHFLRAVATDCTIS